MPRYLFSVIVRPDNSGYGTECELQANITACNEEEARRRVLNRAYHDHLLVSEFTRVEVRGEK